VADLDRLGTFSAAAVTSGLPQDTTPLVLSPDFGGNALAIGLPRTATGGDYRFEPLVTASDPRAIMDIRGKWCRSTNSTLKDTALLRLTAARSVRPAVGRTWP